MLIKRREVWQGECKFCRSGWGDNISIPAHIHYQIILGDKRKTAELCYLEQQGGEGEKEKKNRQR